MAQQDKIDAMSDEQIEAMSVEEYNSQAKAQEYQAFFKTLTPEEHDKFFARLEAYNAKHDGRAHGFVRFLKTLGDVATLRFADAAEMAADGDTEN